MYLPPQHAFLSLDAARTGKRRGHRIVLTGEAAAEEVAVGDVGGRHGGNVLIGMPGGSEPSAIDQAGILPLRGWLPLVVPYSNEAGGRSLQTDAKAAYTGKQLHNPNVAVVQFDPFLREEAQLPRSYMGQSGISGNGFAQWTVASLFGQIILWHSDCL